MKLSWLPVVIKIKMEKKKKDAMLTDKSLIENFAPKKSCIMLPVLLLHFTFQQDCSPFPVISST